MQRHPWNLSRPIVTWHRGSARAKIKQREREQPRQNSLAPPSNCELSLSLSPSAKLLRGEARLHRTRITMIYVAIQGRRDVPSIQRETSSLSWSRGYHELSPPRPSIVRGVAARTKALACEISRANTLSATVRGCIPWSDRGRERDTFSREKLLSNAITICYGAHTLRGLTTIGTMRTVCACIHGRRGERKIERRKESGRSIDIDHSRELDRGWEN